MADKQVVRQDVVQITWDVQDSPIGKITGEAKKLQTSIGKAVGTSESKFGSLTKSVKKTQSAFKGTNTSAKKFTTALKSVAKTSLTKLKTGIDKVKASFQDANTKAGKLWASMKKIGKENFAKLNTGINNIAKKLGTGLVTAAKKAATAIAAIGAGVAVGSFKLADMASDLSETINKVEVSFGDSANSVKSWSKNSIKDMGLAQQTALDMAALFGDMGTGMGIPQKEAANMSMELTQLGADLASFKNMDIEEVTTALNGVFTGETESLKRLGVVMTQANLESFALSKGLKKPIDEMSESEKVMLRYEYVLSKTKNAQGDFARTGGGFANQLRMAKEQLKQIGTTIGGVFIGGFEKALQKVNTFGAELNTKLSEVLADGFQYGDVAKIAPLLGPVGTALQKVADKIHSITSNKEKMAQIKGVFDALKTAAGKVGEFIGTAAGKITDFVTSAGFLNTVKTVADGIGNAFGFFSKHLDTIMNIAIPLAAGIAGMIGTIKLISAAIKVWSAVQWVLNSGLLACPITWIVVAIGALIAIIVVLVRNWDKVKAAAQKCWGAIKDAWGKASAWLDEKVVQPIKKAFQGAWDFVTDLWSGITDFFSGLWDGIKNIVSKITGKANEAKGDADKVKATKHAKGGLITKPHLGLVGEAGPEMIIPLRDRKRGLALWAQAGQMLGAAASNVSPVNHLSESYQPSTSANTGRQSYSENNTYAPSFTLNFTGTTDRTAERTVKQWVKESMEEMFDSMSRTSPRLTEV